MPYVNRGRLDIRLPLPIEGVITTHLVGVRVKIRVRVRVRVRLERLRDEGGVPRDVGRLEARRLEAAEQRRLRAGWGRGEC